MASAEGALRMNHPIERPVRSFVRRAGRLTPAQRRAMRELWPCFGIEIATAPLDLDRVFGRTGASRVLEIGYGNGESLIELASIDPDADFVGIEVHEPGIGHCLLEIERRGIGNVRLLRGDATDLLRHALPPGAFDRINLYFPDPWPKKRHHKRRIVNESFLALAQRALKADGRLHVATDWAPYAEQISSQLGATDRFEIVEHREHDGSRPLERVTTRFERRGIALGHRINDWIARRR